MVIIKKHTFKKLLILVTLVLIVLISVIMVRGSSISKNSAFSKKLNDDIDKYASALKFNGSVFVAKKGDVLLSKAYGMSNKEQQIINTTQTKFYIPFLSWGNVFYCRGFI